MAHRDTRDMGRFMAPIDLVPSLPRLGMDPIGLREVCELEQRFAQD